MIDDTDKKILAILQENARTSNAEIARQVGMAPSAILERIRKLERRGIVQGYEARLNAKELGLGLTAFTMVTAEEAVGRVDTGEQLAAVPGVMEVHYTAGQAAYLVKVRVPDTEGLANLLQEIGRIPSVRDTNSTIVLRTVKESAELPLEQT